MGVVLMNYDLQKAFIVLIQIAIFVGVFLLINNSGV